MISVLSPNATVISDALLDRALIIIYNLKRRASQVLLKYLSTYARARARSRLHGEVCTVYINVL